MKPIFIFSFFSLAVVSCGPAPTNSAVKTSFEGQDYQSVISESAWKKLKPSTVVNKEDYQACFHRDHVVKKYDEHYSIWNALVRRHIDLYQVVESRESEARDRRLPRPEKTEFTLADQIYFALQELNESEGATMCSDQIQIEGPKSWTLYEYKYKNMPEGTYDEYVARYVVIKPNGELAWVVTDFRMTLALNSGTTVSEAGNIPGVQYLIGLDTARQWIGDSTERVAGKIRYYTLFPIVVDENQ